MKIIKKDNIYFLNPEGNDCFLLSNFINKKLVLKPISKEVLAIVSLDNNLDGLSNDVILDNSTYNNFSKKESYKKSDILENDSFEDKSIKKKIFDLLNDKNITSKDKVEGSFEKFLNFKDLKVFKEMLKNKEINVFKLSDKYKKGIYKIDFDKLNILDNNISNNYLDVDILNKFKENNYLIIKNQKDVNIFLDKYKNQIQNNEIIGLKSFDSNYYIISVDLYNDLKDLFLKTNFENEFGIEKVISNLNISEDISKILIEILKEDCLVIEKRKGVFKIV
ncbi:MAG: hypothetical protein PHR26_00040 [Candidatus ainarchaeum sp.]|nr:hypothetical protein [Candidatus ainarchaeum sp.]MDD3976087.1 hypothetical protein [Candidatus ainarchaeum sp.]